MSIEQLAVSSGFSVSKYVFMVSPGFVPVRYSIRALVSSAVFPRKLFKPFFLFGSQFFQDDVGFRLGAQTGEEGKHPWDVAFSGEVDVY